MPTRRDGQTGGNSSIRREVKSIIQVAFIPIFLFAPLTADFATLGKLPKISGRFQAGLGFPAGFTEEGRKTQGRIFFRCSRAMLLARDLAWWKCNAPCWDEHRLRRRLSASSRPARTAPPLTMEKVDTPLRMQCGATEFRFPRGHAFARPSICSVNEWLFWMFDGEVWRGDSPSGRPIRRGS